MRDKRFVLLCAALLAAAAVASPISANQGASRGGRRAGVHGRHKTSRAAKDVDALAGALKARGLAVESAGDVSQPFFSAGGRALTVGGENVQVFRYRTAEAARREAARISPDGSDVGTSMMTWVAAPHFFRAGQLIVLYVGDDPKVLAALRAELGAQFAGR